MHFYTHLKPESKGKTGFGIYADGMVEHDGHVGELLNLLDDLKITDNTIVIYTCDNGPHYNEWPDGGISPFRGEKNTNWEGGYRVPGMVRWPARFKAGSVSNGIVSHLDWVPTLMAAVGETDINAKLKKGHKGANKEYRVHMDGYNLLPHLTGSEKEMPRREFFYFSDDGVLVGLRYNQWKLVFAEQRAARFDVWRDPFVMLRAPKIFNLRSDPFERADTDSNSYNHWWAQRAFLLAPAQQYVGKFLATFKEFPPRQTPAKFNLDDVMKTLTEASGNN
jgi:arylsulfatase